MAYDSVLVGQYLLALAKGNGIALNATQLQKLLYIAFGHFLAQKSRIIMKEQPKAWPFGPVFPRVHKKVNIQKDYKISDSSFDEIRNDQELTEGLEKILIKYSKFSAGQLSDWSHSPGSPWDRTTKMPGFNWNMPIPNECLIEYFKQIEI